MSFNNAKNAVKERAEQLLDSMTTDLAFVALIDNKSLWDVYLESFPPEERKSHDCHACHGFIKRYGKIVFIDDNFQRTTIWDLPDVEEPYKTVFENMHLMVSMAPICRLFLPSERQLGIPQNLAITEHGKYVTWEHFNITLPEGYTVVPNNQRTRQRMDEAVLNESSTYAFTLQRAFTEISLGAVETAIELIQSNQVARGREFLGMVENFKQLLLKYNQLEDNQKSNFCWYVAGKRNQSTICRIRNTAIGTLLNDLSDPAITPEQAVNRFEGKMDSYKRPQAIVTASTSARAIEDFRTDGYEDSLDRRYATPLDVPTNQALYVHNPVVAASNSVLDLLAQDVSVDPRKFLRSPEVSLEDFLANILSSAEKVEVLLENRLNNNMMTMFAAKNPEAPNLLKWDNTYTWSYNGNNADSIRELVKAAGGNVEGKLRLSLRWYNTNDLDLHVKTTNPAHHIYYGIKAQRVRDGGMLDVDANWQRTTSTPVENVIFDHNSQLLNRAFEVSVHTFKVRENNDDGFMLELEYAGETYTYQSQHNPGLNQFIMVVQFKIDGKGNLEIIKQLNQPNSNVRRNQICNLWSNQFHTVNLITFSPNHWGENHIGNKHIFMFLEGALPDQELRPLYNEYIKDPIVQKHKRVLEVLGGKIKPEGKPELTGVGFSTSRPNYFICRVQKEGKQSVFKVNI